MTYFWATFPHPQKPTFELIFGVSNCFANWGLWLGGQITRSANFCLWCHPGGSTLGAPRRKTFFRKNSRRLELSISKNTSHGRSGQGPGSVDPRFPAGLPFPVPEILELFAFHDSGNFFPAIFPGLSRSFPREPPNRSRKQPQPSRVFWFVLVNKCVRELVEVTPILKWQTLWMTRKLSNRTLLGHYSSHRQDYRPESPDFYCFRK